MAGLVGVVLVFLPGIALQVVAVVIWAVVESTAGGWAVAGITLVIAAATSVFKYLHPGRQLRAAGIPNGLMFAAVAVATVGLFVIPIIGAPLGFVLTIYVFERRRRGKVVAWPSTKTAIRAIITSTGIELAGAFTIAVVFVAGTIVT